MFGKSEKEKLRFERVYAQGALSSLEVWVDRETGVNYLWVSAGHGGGVTVMLDRDGKPLITPVVN